MKTTLKPLFLRLAFTLLAFISLSMAYGSDGIDPVSGKKGGPAETTADLLKRRLLLQRLNSQGGDPLYFMLRSNKTQVKPGEEVEITISVHLLQDAHKTFIVYEELFGYTLRLTMPEGFVVTSGTYHDLLRDRVTRRDPVKTYNVKGYFREGSEGGEFKLLRGTFYHNSQESMVFKQSLYIYHIPVEEPVMMDISKQVENQHEIVKDTLHEHSRKARTAIHCDGHQDVDNFFQITEFDFKNCPEKYNIAGMAEFYITIKNLTNVSRSAFYYVCHGNGLFNEQAFTLGPNEIKTFFTSTRIQTNLNNYPSIHAHVSMCAVGGTYNSPVADVASTRVTIIRDLLRILPTPALTGTLALSSRNTVFMNLQNCPAGAKVDWYHDGVKVIDNGSSRHSFTALNPSYSIYAVCKMKYCSMTSNTAVVTLVDGTDCSLVPNPVLSADIHQVMKGGNFKLSVENCGTNIKWYKNGTLLTGINDYTYNTGEVGTYHVSCEVETCGVKNSNTISVSNAGNPLITADINESAVYANQKINLTAIGNCNTEWRWGDGQVGQQVQVTGPGTYSVRCQNREKSSIFSTTAVITFGLKTINVPTLTQENSLCLYEGQTKYITATCPTGYIVYWDETPANSNYNSKAVSAGTYSAKCCDGGNCGGLNTIVVKSCEDIGCLNLPEPKVSIDPHNVLAGAYFRLDLTGCNGSVVWHRNNEVYPVPENGSATSFYTREPGVYHVTCEYSECHTVLTSEGVEPVYDDIRIEHNQPNNEIVAGVPFQLRAVGCAEGAVEWYTAAGTIRHDNPIWESLPGLYKARCRKDDNVYSDWATVFMTLRSANTPQFYKPDQCFYANQTLYIAGNCPTGMTLRWENSNTATSFPAYRQVTPGTYSAQCCNGSNCSAMTPVTVCTIDPNIQQIITDKDDPMTGIAYAAPNEPVLLTATGCQHGTVQWMYGGQTQSGNPVTVYGPGKYYARCYVADHSTSPMISREIYPRAPGSVSIIPSQSTAFQGQMLTLTATGCNGGQVHWTYTQAGQTYNLSGRSIDVVGPNTYYAKCIVYGDTGPQSSITIPQASDIPKIITDKSRVRPNETFTFQVDFSSCPSYGWPGGHTLVTQEGVTTSMWGWDPITLTGPAVLEARCENAPWAKQTKEIFFAPGDNMRLVANKSKAKHNESVLLTTYGCDYGYVEWKIGNNNILGHALDPKRQITQTGPGFYKARCKDDFMVNSDWVTVYVELDGTIVPVINGPNSLCPNTAATVTTAGCPAGYYNSWSTLEQGGFAYSGNSITVYLPQTVKLRCIKNDDSWGSDEKPFTIASAIPDDIKATSNSPVVSGGTALLNATTITGATYLWTPPAGVTLPVVNTRALQIPNVTPAHSGEYKLKVTSGGCVVDVSTRVDVGLCDNLYIKAFDPTSGEEKTRLNRKPGQLNLYDDLVLQVQTFEGDILKGVEYTWTLPQGVTANQNSEDKSKITINKIGNYKVNVTSTGGVSCPLEVDISALACATPTDFLNCGSTSSITSTGTEKLKNLAVGDVFSTYDYVVSVTEVSGSESTGWTGRGMIEMSFLKLGPTAMKVPLGVRFNNIHLNQCYQLLPGSKVITEFDESWSNVMSVDDIVKNTLTEISDILSSYKAGDNSKLSELSTTLSSNISQIQANPYLTQDQKNMMVTAINSATSSISCLVNTNPNSRINASSCSVENVQSQIHNSTIEVEAANDRDCQCDKPTSTGTEGDKIVASGTKYVTNRFEGGTTITCKKTWIYHSSYDGGIYPSGWYYSEDYEKIETFVKDKIGPLIFVHGTFSSPGAFTSDFKRNIHKYLKMSIPEKDAIAQFQWSGGNTVADREAAATEMGKTLNSAISKNLLKKLGYEKHIILVCHSHGGNVAKRLKNILEAYDSSWTVDVINIETPQRADFQFNSTSGKVLNFWSNGDIVQWLGTIKDADNSNIGSGPLGVRKDPKADVNIQLLPRIKLNLESYGGEMYQWLLNYGGHSLQGDSWYQWQIYYHINKSF